MILEVGLERGDRCLAPGVVDQTNDVVIGKGVLVFFAFTKMPELAERGEAVDKKPGRKSRSRRPGRGRRAGRMGKRRRPSHRACGNRKRRDTRDFMNPIRLLHKSAPSFQDFRTGTPGNTCVVLYGLGALLDHSSVEQMNVAVGVVLSGP